MFDRIANILVLLEANRFRVNAFARGARVLEDLSEDIAARVDRNEPPSLKKLLEIDGIGKRLAEIITEYVTTGRVQEYDELLAQVPPGLFELMRIPGLGPKTIALLWKQAGVTSLADLKAKVADDALASLPGLGKKKLENLRVSLAFAETASERVNIGRALPVAESFIAELCRLPQVKQAAYAGSLRRGRETIGDIDLLVAADESDAQTISDAFVRMTGGAEVLAKGKTKTSIRTSGLGGRPQLQVDLRIVAPEQFGAALMYFTGSKEHNVAMRERAIRMGCSLNEYALTRDGACLAGRSEEEVFAALGLAWVPPELRENRGELALSEGKRLPQLIEPGDIRAELHAHTTASDGKWSIRELAEFCAARGYHTVAVTDHSKSQAIAGGLSEERLLRHVREVREVAAAMKDTIQVLAGSEVDILADGQLDYPDSVLAELDIVVASPHAALSQEPAKATQRLLRALENPFVTILGHPTGRIIGRRAGLAPDMNAVLRAVAARGVAVEINANSHRLDLRDMHARVALEAGTKLSINTDAHGPGDVGQLPFGILTARRAGARASDVVNTFDRQALADWIHSTRI